MMGWVGTNESGRALSALAGAAVIGLVALGVGCSGQSKSGGSGGGGDMATNGGAASNVGGKGNVANGGATTGGATTGGATTGGATTGGATTGGATTGGATTGGDAAGADNATQPYTQIRFMQAYLKDGVKTSYDLWSRKNDQSWVSLVRGLSYGTLTDYLTVPIGAGRNTMIWYIPPGADPAKYEIDIGSFIRYALPDSETGRHTSFMFHVPGEVDWATQFILDGDPELTPPSGYAYVLFTTDAIRPIYPTLDYGETAACIDRDTQDSYQPIPVGSHTFAVYSGDSASGCHGGVIASAPATQIGDGDVWLLWAIGDDANGVELRPVKLTRN